MCDNCPPVEPAAVAWADQLRAEIREEARRQYLEAAQKAGVRQAPSERLWETLYDPMFVLGAHAAIVVLARHDYLNRGSE